MRVAVLIALIGLALFAAHSGHLGVALAIAALKTALVGHSYMELSHAHPVHRWGFTLLAAALALGLVVAAG